MKVPGVLVSWLPETRRLICLAAPPSTDSIEQAPSLTTARARIVGVMLLGRSPYEPAASAADELLGPIWIQFATTVWAWTALD